MANFQKRITPVMGWSSWNAFGFGVNEEKLIGQMDAFIKYSLKDYGYEYVNLDDGWQKGRDRITGRVNWDASKFPHGMKHIADQAHIRGLKAGMYTDAGDNTCGGTNRNNGMDKLDPNDPGYHTGLYVGDANQGKDYSPDDLRRYLGDGFYADEYARTTGEERDRVECWGYDFIKVDWCGGRDNQLSQEERYSAYDKVILEIEEENNKDKIYNVCGWGYNGEWNRRVGDSWRMGGDIDMSGRNFNSIIRTIDGMKRVGHHTLPGHIADPDMLVVGKHLRPEEDRSHFAMWCMFAAPLVHGFDLTTMRAETLELITNMELIGIDQDPACICASYIKNLGTDVELWVKPFGSADSREKAVALFNRYDSAQTVTLDFSELGIKGAVSIRDVINHKDLGIADRYTVNLSSHDTVVLKIVCNENIVINAKECGCESPGLGVCRVEGAFAKTIVKSWNGLLIDVRSKDEYDNYHIDGAINVEYTMLADIIGELEPDKSRHIVLYCSNAKRSAQAADAIYELGYYNVHNVGSIRYYPVE